MKIRTISILICAIAILMSVPAAHAASTDEARILAEDGNIDGAIDMLVQLAQESPKNADIPKMLGDMYLAAGNDTAAQQAYQTARKNGSREAILALAEMANLNYEVDEARELVEAYRKTLKKGKRTLAPDQSGDIDDRIDRTENMLARVEQIEVIDSLVVDADEFFRHYRLSPESGSLHSPDVLPAQVPAADPTVVN
ncbi:MAG: tetratricopeptide repeat protein, partial [Muribaculaceae bacterium]|nr:tetratricopeptide repeat protein [Muribaculaceae bacterium]